MVSYHSNQLNVVSLFDAEETYDSPGRSSGMLTSATSGHSGATDAGNEYFHGHKHVPQVSYGFGGRPVEPERFIASSSGNQDQEYKGKAGFRTEDNMSPVSYPPSDDSDYYESAGEDFSPHKTQKLNKDGAPRKPRQPRPKLLKWTDNDWKNVVLGIIWACGEQGVQIPFSQAAQLVGENCTASALQQAVLKLRGKQIAEGHQIPVLKMAWTRKNRNRRSSTPIANTKSAQVQVKSPTWKRVLQKAKSSLVVKLKVGRRGISSKQPEAHVLSMTGTQPETSMLSMNGINSMSSGAYALSTNNIKPGSLALPVNNMFSGTSTPAYWAQSHQPLYQGQLQGMQPSQLVSTETKRYHRNHFVARNGMFDEYFNLVATVDELPGYKQSNTAERKSFSTEDLVNLESQPDMLSTEDLGGLHSDEKEPQYHTAVSNDMQGLSYLHSQEQELRFQPAVSNDIQGLSDLHSEEHELLNHPEEDPIDFSSFINYEAYLAGLENYVPQDNVFKTES